MVSHHGEQGPGGTALFHWEWTGGCRGWGEDQTYAPPGWLEALDTADDHDGGPARSRSAVSRALRVVDTTDATSWSSARLLADLGADVIRVESLGRRVDRARRDAQRQQALGRARRSDDELLALLGHADIWFDTGDTTLDVADVRRGAPQLVVVSISAVRPDRPLLRRTRRRTRSSTRCRGQLPLCRLPGRPPLLPPGQLAFEVASAMAAYAALVAVWNRAVTGAGDHSTSRSTRR